jgi:hypothetical protein
MRDADFSELVGKTLASITAQKVEDDVVTIKTEDGKTYIIDHSQDCCECVQLERVEGDLENLIGSPIVAAEEVADGDVLDDLAESYTWTTYKLTTDKGSVTLRWYGVSNGYYSEVPSFKEV